jgi:hypothetical protein
MPRGKKPRRAITRRSKIELPNGNVVRWRDILNRYHEQIEGQAYTRERMKSDLRKKREAFRYVKQLADLYKETENISEVARRVGKHKQSIHRILSRGKLPHTISPERHEYHQRTRQKPRMGKATHGDKGYFLGLHAAKPINLRRNKQTGRSKITFTTASESYADRLQETFSSVLGTTTGRSKPTMRSGAKRPQHTVSVQSAELLKGFRRVVPDPERPWKTLPSSPEARKNFAKALFDRGRSYIEGERAVALTHREPEVLELVSHALTEQGIPHERKQYRGEDSIVIGKDGMEPFKKKIGFRDEEKHSRIPT